jgi:hypothetical protein
VHTQRLLRSELDICRLKTQNVTLHQYQKDFSKDPRHPHRTSSKEHKNISAINLYSHAGAARLCFVIQCGAPPHKAHHVSNVHTQPPTAAAEALDISRL